MTDPSPLIQAVLSEHRHKPARVQTRLVLDAIRHLLAADDAETVEAAPLPETLEWRSFRQRLDQDPHGSLVDFGLATTRNRTHGAYRALGLDPHDIRAVVIEPDQIRVYPYRKSSYGLPILEEKSA